MYSEEYRTQLQAAPQRLKKLFPGYLANVSSIQQAITQITQAEGRVTAGTDSPFIPYGTSLHTELQIFVDGGLTPFQALQAATIRAAEAVGVASDLGSIEEGKVADLVIVDGDPLANISDAWNVVTTVKNGIRYEIDDLLTSP